MVVSSTFRCTSSSIREEEIKNTAIKKLGLKKMNIIDETIFPHAIDVEYVDNALWQEELDEDYNPAADDDDNDDDDKGVLLIGHDNAAILLKLEENEAKKEVKEDKY